MKFVMNLNGTDEDRKQFKESLRKEIEATGYGGVANPDNHSEHHSYTTAQKKSVDRVKGANQGEEDSEGGGVSMHNEEEAPLEEDENAEQFFFNMG
mmetsp:Transcript_18768/g.28862  ORF Transcript_18768/g.28862 Transcript_18768/m.28862 type:complete len:96 (+) Transcript_18768:1285-1572(+)